MTLAVIKKAYPGVNAEIMGRGVLIEESQNIDDAEVRKSELVYGGTAILIGDNWGYYPGDKSPIEENGIE